MSDDGFQSQIPEFSVIQWWNGQRYEPIPPERLDPKTSDVALAISADEYPELAELVAHADDMDAYLEQLGVEDRGEPMGKGQGAPAGG